MECLISVAAMSNMALREGKGSMRGKTMFSNKQCPFGLDKVKGEDEWTRKNQRDRPEKVARSETANLSE
jgi:hypothetical protein